MRSDARHIGRAHAQGLASLAREDVEQGKHDLKSIDGSQLKKLNRIELLELLVEQGEQLESTQEELEAVQARAAHQERIARLAEDAAARLSGILEAAQLAQAQYMQNLRELKAQMGIATETVSAEESIERDYASAGAAPVAMGMPSATAATSVDAGPVASTMAAASAVDPALSADVAASAGAVDFPTTIDDTASDDESAEVSTVVVDLDSLVEGGYYAGAPDNASYGSGSDGAYTQPANGSYPVSGSGAGSTAYPSTASGGYSYGTNTAAYPSGYGSASGYGYANSYAYPSSPAVDASGAGAGAGAGAYGGGYPYQSDGSLNAKYAATYYDMGGEPE